MSEKILLAPNSFKESADAITISNILSKEFQKSSTAIIIEKPISDGGDGFLPVCENIFKGIRLTYLITNIYNNQLNSVEVLYSEQNQIIYIESAEICGLKKVPDQFRDPMILNTSNLGELISKIAVDVDNKSIHIRKIVIGVGGTATVDFGLGVCSSFGLKLFDEYDNELNVIPANFIKTKKLSWVNFDLPFSIEIIADVKTALLGENNAIQMYSGQKGADVEAIDTLLKGFSNIHNLLLNNRLIESDHVLNGSGGGLAAGLGIFFDAKIINAYDFISDHIIGKLNLSEFDAVITGEGAFDKQSLEIKGAYVIIDKFLNLKIPIFIVCGSFDPSILQELPESVRIIELQKFFGSKEESIVNFNTGIQKAVKEIIDLLKI